MIGTFFNEIEIWDLDLADPIQPQNVLKGHSGPVTSLGIHPTRSNVLVSGSADQTVKVWDLSTTSLVDTISLQNGEIQNLSWSPAHESNFVCQSGQNTLQMFDLKASNEAVASVNLKCAPIDSIEFNSLNTHQVFVASEDGVIAAFDIRALSQKPIYRIQAHNKSVPGLASAGEYLVSNSLDGRMRIWDLKAAEQMKLVKEKQTPLKKLLESSIHPENPFLFACGAEGAEVVVWDFYQEVVKGAEAQNPKVSVKKEGQAKAQNSDESDDGLDIE